MSWFDPDAIKDDLRESVNHFFDNESEAAREKIYDVFYCHYFSKQIWDQEDHADRKQKKRDYIARLRKAKQLDKRLSVKRDHAILESYVEDIDTNPATITALQKIIIGFCENSKQSDIKSYITFILKTL